MNFNFKKLPPFKWFVLQNFPFIEADFDAITYYQLLCKIVEYLNDENKVINVIGEQTENLTNAFNELQDYVNHYFDTLDIQEEINNKLDEMATDGTLQEIISDYLNSQAIFCYDTVNDMKQATNLINGSYAKTLGYHSINDGGGPIYKIKDTNELENGAIITLNNSLQAHLNYNDEINVKTFGAYGNNTNDDTQAFKNAINFCKNNNIINLFIPQGLYILSDNFKIDFTLNINGEYSQYQELRENSRNGTVLIDNYSGNEPFILIESTNTTEVTPEKRIWGGKISNIQIDGKETTNHFGLYLHRTGWEGLIENVYIRNYFTTAIFIDRVFDTNFENLVLINNGSKNNSNVNYSMVITDTDGTDTSNALRFNNLHIEHSRYCIKFDKAKNLMFSGIKIEPRLNKNEIDNVNSFIETTNNTQEITFTNSVLVPPSINQWLEKNVSLFTIPYMFNIVFSSNRTKNIMFIGCQFTTPDDSGSRFIKGNYNVSISNCSFDVMSVKCQSIHLEYALIENSNFLFQNSESGISQFTAIEIGSTKITNCTFRLYESQTIATKILFHFLDGANKISNCEYTGFNYLYNFDVNVGEVTNNSSTFERNSNVLTLTNSNITNYIQGSYDTTNIVLDARKIPFKSILVNINEDITISRILYGLNSEKIVFISNGHTQTFGNGFDNYGTYIRASQSSASTSISGYGSVELMKHTNYWKIISKN